MLMHSPDLAAHPTYPPREGRLNRPFLALIRLILTPAARLAGFSEPRLIRGEELVKGWHEFEEGKARLILGFRHAYGDDPQLTGYTVLHSLPKEARRLGRPFRRKTHVAFIYGGEVPLWSPPFVRFLLPAVGALPISHLRADSGGMNRIRAEILDGPFPVALAPEGHVTYLSRKVSEIENGAARFGFWCMEDLERAGRAERTLFIPLSYHYEYPPRSVRKLNALVTEMEGLCGIERPSEPGAFRAVTSPADGRLDSLSSRLDGIASRILALTAAFYGLPADSPQEDVLEAAIASCERGLGMGIQDSRAPVMERFYRMRALGWSRIYRDDLDSLLPLERRFADRLAAEAWFAMRHMETAELLFHVPLRPEGETRDGAALTMRLGALFERGINYADILERSRGGTLKHRRNPARKTPIIVAGQPVVFDDFREAYRSGRKEALRSVTYLIAKRFEECVKEYENGH